MRNSKGGPFLGESLSLTDSCTRVVPAAWFSWKHGERERERERERESERERKGRGVQSITKAHKPTLTRTDCYLHDGCGVGRGEDRRVVVDIRHVDVQDDGGGHGGGAAVERLH